MACVPAPLANNFCCSQLVPRRGPFSHTHPAPRPPLPTSSVSSGDKILQENKRFLDQIADSIANPAPRCPCRVYHVLYRTMHHIGVTVLLASADRQPANLPDVRDVTSFSERLSNSLSSVGIILLTVEKLRGPGSKPGRGGSGGGRGLYFMPDHVCMMTSWCWRCSLPSPGFADES